MPRQANEDPIMYVVYGTRKESRGTRRVRLHEAYESAEAKTIFDSMKATGRYLRLEVEVQVPWLDWTAGKGAD